MTSFSYVVITNWAKPSISEICISSILAEAKDGDEVIVVGNINTALSVVRENTSIRFIEASQVADSGNISKLRNTGVEAATCAYVVNMDDDILLPKGFRDTMSHYIDRTGHEVFNTRMLLPDGGRYWDRAIYIGENSSYMVDYSSTDPGLYYSGSFIVRSRELCDKVLWDEGVLFYDSKDENEDIKMTKSLKELGYNVNIDVGNLAIHLDDSYWHVVNKEHASHTVIRQHSFDKTRHVHIRDKSVAKIYRETILNTENVFGGCF